MRKESSGFEENEGTKIKKVTSDNIATEHICCAITESKTDRRVETKKAWMKERFADGLTFLKLDVRGKVFIEYIPVEHAWCPVEANDYLFMNCFWVSGQYKGKGHADRLLTACIEDAKAMGKKGLVALSSRKKMPFLSDPKYLKYKGFKTYDRAEPFR